MPISVLELAARVLVRPFIRRLKLAISVVIVTRNSATYLDLALMGLAKQNIASNLWELIILDNASSDDTANIIDKYVSFNNLNTVRLSVEQMLDHAQALNKAISVATGQIVVFIGDDQLITSNFLLHHLRFHAKHEGAVGLGFAHNRVHTHLFSTMHPALEGVNTQPIFYPKHLQSSNSYQQLIASAFVSPNTNINILAASQHFTECRPENWKYFNTSNASIHLDNLHFIGLLNRSFGQTAVCEDEMSLRLCQNKVPFGFIQSNTTLHQIRPIKEKDLKQLALDLRSFLSRNDITLADATEIRRKRLPPRIS